MKFQPKTAAEVAAPKPFEKGIYDAEIKSAEAVVSKSGKDMIKMQVKVFSHDGAKSVTIFDYLMGDNMEFKLRHAAEACELLSSYDKGEIEPFEFEGKSVKVKLGVRKSEEYGDQNTIVDYIVTEAPKAAAKLDDDIPF